MRVRSVPGDALKAGDVVLTGAVPADVGVVSVDIDSLRIRLVAPEWPDGG